MMATTNLQAKIFCGTALLLGLATPVTRAADTAELQLAMMMDDMMGMMGGMKGGMPPADNPMSAPSPSGAMRPPMSSPPSMSNMPGRARNAGTPDSMAPRSKLPGSPGASHLYHIGATGFFLDHPQHITLSTDQQAALNRIKEKALLEQSTFDRRIEDAEQDLWTLTAADTPDAAKIEPRVRGTEKLRADQRMAFISAVGEASKILTLDQRAVLLGSKPPMGTLAPTSGKPAVMPPM